MSISYASISGIRQFIVQIPRIDATVMGYWIAGQARTIMRSVMCKSNLRMGEKYLRRILMMPCAVLLRADLKSDSSISLLVSGRGGVDSLGGAL